MFFVDGVGGNNQSESLELAQRHITDVVINQLCGAVNQVGHTDVVLVHSERTGQYMVLDRRECISDPECPDAIKNLVEMDPNDCFDYNQPLSFAFWFVIVNAHENDASAVPLRAKFMNAILPQSTNKNKNTEVV